MYTYIPTLYAYIYAYIYIYMNMYRYIHVNICAYKYVLNMFICLYDNLCHNISSPMLFMAKFLTCLIDLFPLSDL